MKKAFAVMSAFLLALTCVGLLSKATVAAAEDLTFVVDPTLAEDEDPMYIMDSIYSTFPHYYRNSEKFDDKWQGSSRMYPWNETRLRVQQYDLETGEATGRYYAIYFAGSLTHMSGKDKNYGAGKNVLFYALDDAGEVQLSRMELGKWYHNRNAGDPSLSHMNTNVTGQDLYVDIEALFAKVGDNADPGRMMNQALVFDAQGRAIRGSVGNAVFLEPGTDGAAATLLAPLFCYVDGKVVKYEAGVTTPDKIYEPLLDENGEVVVDEEGNPVPDLTKEKDHLLYKRFTWAWFEEKPENVNEVGYLEAGWDPNKWDYCYEQDGGYMCYAFMGTDGSEELLDAEALAAYNENLKAEWIAEGKAEEEFVAKTVNDVKREVITHFYIPAGGWTYDFGYLDKGTALLEEFQKMFVSALRYGRAAQYGEQRTYNFSTSGLIAEDRVINEVGLHLMENNVIEVMPGTVINPSKNIVYTGLSQYWDKGEDGLGNDLTKFVSDSSVCEFYIKLDGSTVVMPPKYESWDALVADFMADLNAWRKSKLSEADQANYVDVAAPTAAEVNGSASAFYTTFNGYLDSFYGDANSFPAQPEYWAKWGWVYEYIIQHVVSGVTFDLNTKKSSSPGQWTCTVAGFLAQAPTGSGWPCNKGDYTNAAADLLTVVKWGEFQFTASEELDQSYEVEYTVKNKVTGNESTTTITYVVTDIYTPTIEVNKAALNVKTEVKDGKVVINDGQPITVAQLLTAYNGKYVALTGDDVIDIKGRDITYKVSVDSETLDLENPTEGKHSVVAKVVAQSATTYKEAVERFTVVVRDRTAPVVTVSSETINLAYGSAFDPQIGVVAASDNVDGNLKLAAHTWCIDLSETPVNTTKPGTYTVKLGIYDASGNSRQVSYKVKVTEGYPSAEALEEIADIAEENGFILADLQEAVDQLKTNAGGAASCAATPAALAVQILSASSLLVLVLRKRH